MAHAPSAARRIIGNWEITEVLGSGSFAIVWKARHTTTGTLAAVKEVLTDRLNKKLLESLESEIATLQRLKHANIVGLLDLFKVRASACAAANPLGRPRAFFDVFKRPKGLADTNTRRNT